MPLGVGDAVGSYEVVRLLGRGACGEVFQVRGPGRGNFAMKVIPCDASSCSEAARARQAALMEAKLLQGLRHPHIVACAEVIFDEPAQVVRLVLEYMDGGDLQGLLLSRRDAGGRAFPAHFARRVLAAVGGALAHVHRSGVLHRDIKPANVLLARRSQRIKLGDFGIAKLVEAATLKAQTLVGTPYYFSPELVSGDEYGTASDCWALGACLYEVAALRRPFEAGNQLALIRKICEEAPEALPAETAEDVRAAIDGLLEKRPERRMALADALFVSPAVSALVVDRGEEENLDASEEEEEDWESGEEVQEEVVGEEGAAVTVLPTLAAACVGHGGGDAATMLPPGEGEGEDSWAGAEALGTQAQPRSPRGGAVAQARAVLAADVDDPEDLQLALAALEREIAEGGDALDCSGPDAAARESLGEELRVRLGALREEASALLDGLFQSSAAAAAPAARPAGGTAEASSSTATSRPATAAAAAAGSAPAAAAEEGGGAEAGEAGDGSDGGASAVSTPRGASSVDAEEVLEVATTLGVDTEPAEERIASVRRMLSVRVLWGDTARFCLLPMRVTHAALVRQVASRFGLPASASVRLWWTEAGEEFELDGQPTWEECLQRRGLMEHPGRIELRVRGPPPRRRRRVQSAAEAMLPAAIAASSATAAAAAIAAATARVPRSRGGGPSTAAGSADPGRVSTASGAPAAAVAVGAAEASQASPPPATGAGFLVTGTQAFRGSVGASLELLPPGGPEACGLGAGGFTMAGPPRSAAAAPPGGPASVAGAGAGGGAGRGAAAARRRKQAAAPSETRRSTAAGKAWAMATGREQPVRWAPAPGGTAYSGWRQSPAGSSPEPPAGPVFCLEGRAAAHAQRPP